MKILFATSSLQIWTYLSEEHLSSNNAFFRFMARTGFKWVTGLQDSNLVPRTGWSCGQWVNPYSILLLSFATPYSYQLLCYVISINISLLFCIIRSHNGQHVAEEYLGYAVRPKLKLCLCYFLWECGQVANHTKTQFHKSNTYFLELL